MLDPAVRPPAVECASRSGERRRTLAVAILGSSMAFLDGSAVNVALPVIQRELRVTVDLAQWIIEAYALFLASLVLVGGALGDVLGRKRAFLVGVIVFAIASIACGGAPTALTLVAARALQGIGAALLVPGSLALIGAAYPKNERGRAIGIWSMLTSVTAAVGPVAGGALVAHASWRWIFLFNVPIAIAILALSRKGVADSRDVGKSSMDWIGAGLATAGLGAMVYALIDGGATVGVTGEVGLLAIGAVVLIAFVIHESRASAPMVPLSLFRSRTFAGTNLLTFLLYAALGGALFFLPFALIQVHHYSPAAAGGALLPFIAGISLLSPLMGAIAQRIGTRLLLVTGALVCGGGYVLLALPKTGEPYWTTYFPGVVALGIGMGVVVAPLTTAVMRSVGDARTGTASGVNNAVARAAGLIAIAALGLFLRVRFDDALDRRLATLSLPGDAIARVASERAKLGAADFDDLAVEARDVVRIAFGDAYLDGFRAVMVVAAILSALGAVCAWILLPSRPDVVSDGRPSA